MSNFVFIWLAILLVLFGGGGAKAGVLVIDRDVGAEGNLN